MHISNESAGYRLSDIDLSSTPRLVPVRQATSRPRLVARRPGAASAFVISIAVGTLHLTRALAPGLRVAHADDPDAGDPPAADAARSSGAEGTLAAELVRKLYEEGSWSAGLSSFYLRSETIRTERSEGRAAVPRDREPERPAGTSSAVESPRGSAAPPVDPPAAPAPGAPGAEASKGSTTRYIEEFAFDRKRLRHEYRSEGAAEGDGTSGGVHLWDGEEGVWYNRTADHESYELCKDPGFWGWLDLWGHHEWATVGGYSFWWRPRDAGRYLSDNFLLPEDFTSVGREVFAGAECDVVESRAGFVRLWIGAADHRLRRKVKYVSGDGVDYLKAMRAIGADAIRTVGDWEPWLATLDAADRRRRRKQLAEAAFEASHRKYLESRFDDYRQLGPGRWVPWKATGAAYDTGGQPSTVPRTGSETTVLEVTAEAALPDGLFRLRKKDGVRVIDYRFDLPEELPLEYVWKSDRTDAEVQALHVSERKSLAKHRTRLEGLTAGVAARVGERPHALPETGWVGSKPLRWRDLEGKVAVLYFWAHDCAPCVADLRTFGRDLGAAAEAGVTTIGVHAAAADRREVEGALRSLGLSLPVCIDRSGPGDRQSGELAVWFGVDGAPGRRYPYLGGRGRIRAPYAVVVGKDGRVADHGFLWDALTRARELAAAP